VTIRHGDNSVEFSGDKDTVWSSVNRYFAEVIGPVDALRRIMGEPDVAKLSENLAGKIRIEKGSIVVLEEAEAKKKIAYCLAGSYIAYRLGLRDSDSMTPKEVSESTGLNYNTASNRLAEMSRKGLARKTAGGKYAFASSSLDML